MSLEIELFKLINKREYPAALTLLKQNPTLDINALNEEGGSFFKEAVANTTKESPERYVFIEMLLANPKFQHANKPYTGMTATPAMSALTGDDPTLAELIIKYKDSKNIDVLSYRKKIMYEEQARWISVEEKMLDDEPNVIGAKMLAERKKVLAILLQETVHQAIKIDDPSLLQRLVDAGAKLSDPLKNGTFPMDLVKDKPNLKVHQWLTGYIKTQISSNPTLTLAALNLATTHAANGQVLIKKQMDKTTDAIQNAFKFFDFKTEKPAPQTTAQSNTTIPGK